MDNKTLLERVVEERQHYEQEAQKAHNSGKWDLAINFEGKMGGLLFVERLLTEEES